MSAEQIAEVLAAHTWGQDSPRAAHKAHGFHYMCAICQGDIPAIAAVIAALPPTRASLIAAERERIALGDGAE